MSEREKYLLFWRLTPEDQAKLMEFQFEEYGYRLQIPPPIGGVNIEPHYPSLNEIDREMKKPPKHMRRVT